MLGSAGDRLLMQKHARAWAARHASEMSLVLALEAAGYSRDESRRMAARHMAGEPIMQGHNGGPSLTEQ